MHAMPCSEDFDGIAQCVQPMPMAQATPADLVTSSVNSTLHTPTSWPWIKTIDEAEVVRADPNDE